MTGTARAITAAAAAVLLLSAACTGDKKASSRKESQQVALRIGIVYTTGGQGADLAGPVLGAAKLATDDALKDGVKITVSEADYGGDPVKVAAAVQALATKVDAVVVGSDDTDIAPYLGGLAVPLLHAFITGDSVVSGQDPVFRLAPGNRLQASRIAAFLTGHRKYTRIALITDDTAFGKEGRRNLTAALSEAGVNPIDQAVFTPGKDVHPAVSAAGQKGAQAVVVWVESPGEASRIVVDAHKQNLAYQIVLSGNLATAAFAKNASSQVAPVAFRDGMLSVGTWAGPWFTLERIVRFHREFKKQNSALAPVQSAAVYDAIMALSAAARAQGTTPGALTRGLEGLKDFEAAGVPLTFGPGKHEGIDLDDVGMLGFTKNQSAPGGEFAPEVDTGGGFFSVVTESLDLPDRYAFLLTRS